MEKMKELYIENCESSMTHKYSGKRELWLSDAFVAQKRHKI
jgi:hypothetical protein